MMIAVKMLEMAIHNDIRRVSFSRDESGAFNLGLPETRTKAVHTVVQKGTAQIGTDVPIDLVIRHRPAVFAGS